MVSVSVVVVPEAVLRSNQAALSLSVQDKVPPPILVRANGFADGFAPPTVPEKAKFVGRAPIVPTVMVAVRVPAVNPVRFTLAVTVPLLVPETGLRVNHVELSEALQVKVPPPTFDTARL